MTDFDHMQWNLVLKHVDCCPCPFDWDHHSMQGSSVAQLHSNKHCIYNWTSNNSKQQTETKQFTTPRLTNYLHAHYKIHLEPANHQRFIHL